MGLLVSIVLSTFLLTGCGSYDNNHSTPVKQPGDLTAPASTDSGDPTDWKPTIYESVNNFEGVTMVVKEGTASPVSVTIVFKNDSDRQCIYGQYFCLEKIRNGKWYQVPVSIDGNYGFDDIGYNLAPGDSGEWTAEWEWLYDRLNTGEYRIVKDLLVLKDSGEYDTHYLAAEFTIY